MQQIESGFAGRARADPEMHHLPSARLTYRTKSGQSTRAMVARARAVRRRLADHWSSGREEEDFIRGQFFSPESLPIQLKKFDLPKQAARNEQKI